MKRNAVETILGAFVIVIAAIFVFFFQGTAEIGATSGGYELQARFSRIDGLNRGSPVRISGVNVGKVTDFELDPVTYSAIVTMMIRDDVKVPYDTAATVASESLLGGKFLSLEPGADEEMLQPGDMIEFTQSTPGLEALLGQAIYSFSNKKEDSGSGSAAPARETAPPEQEAMPELLEGAPPEIIKDTDDTSSKDADSEKTTETSAQE